MSQDERHYEHPQRAAGDEEPHHKGPSTFERLEAVAVGALVLVGTMLTISNNHKIAAVWVFFAAYLILGVAVAVRLTGEFAEPPPKNTDKEKTAMLDPTPTPAPTPASAPGNTNITSHNQSGGFTGINQGTINLGPTQRSIPAEARRILIGTLSSAKSSSAKPFVGIDSVFGDTEAKNFADELGKVFEEAGWEVGRAQVGLQPEPIGLVVAARSRDDIPIQVTIIRVALAEAGFGSIPGVFMPGINEHSVRLIVGVKPKE